MTLVCASLARYSAEKKEREFEGTPLKLPAHGLRPRYPTPPLARRGEGACWVRDRGVVVNCGAFHLTPTPLRLRRGELSGWGALPENGALIVGRGWRRMVGGVLVVGWSIPSPFDGAQDVPWPSPQGEGIALWDGWRVVVCGAWVRRF